MLAVDEPRPSPPKQECRSHDMNGTISVCFLTLLQLGLNEHPRVRDSERTAHKRHSGAIQVPELAIAAQRQHLWLTIPEEENDF